MKAQTYFKAGLIIALMLMSLAGFVYLFRQNTFNDGGQQEHLQSSIYNLKQVDANWTAEVLKSYVGLSKDYDALSRSSKHLPHLLSNLSVDLMANANFDAQNTRSELGRLIKEKAILIEKFKRHNAVLKNSLRYLPTAQTEMTTLISSENMTRAKTQPLNTQKEAIDQLVSTVLHYNLFPEEKTAATVQAQNDSMRAMISSMSPALAEKTRNLVRHIDVILQERNGLATLVASINEINIASKLDALSLTIDKTRTIELENQHERRNFAMIYGIAMIFTFITIIFWTTRRLIRLNEVSSHARARLHEMERKLAEKGLA